MEQNPPSATSEWLVVDRLLGGVGERRRLLRVPLVLGGELCRAQRGGHGPIAEALAGQIEEMLLEVSRYLNDR